MSNLMGYFKDDRVYSVYASLLSLVVLTGQVAWRSSKIPKNETQVWLPQSLIAVRRTIAVIATLVSLAQVVLAACIAYKLDVNPFVSMLPLVGCNARK